MISDLIGGNLAAAPVFTGTYNNFEADGSGFSATVKLLSQFGDTKVLSTPRIMALNNQTALLKVVDELVYFTLDVGDHREHRTGHSARARSSPARSTPFPWAS